MLENPILALVLALPAGATAFALAGRRRVRAMRRWPTTVAERTEAGEGFRYVVRGRVYQLAVPQAPTACAAAQAPDRIRLHYCPEDPSRALRVDAPPPPLAEPVLAALAVAALILIALTVLA